MKRVTASEARRRWFSLLDEVASGEVVTILRKGQRIILRRDESDAAPGQRPPDYRDVLKVREAERADSWGWGWSGETLVPEDRGDR
jgi:hypothetical protein